jgi:hypothetical protein
VAAHQRWDLLDPVLATGTPASLSQEAAPRSVRALARRGSGTSPGRWLYTLPGVADHPFASPKMQIPASPAVARSSPSTDGAMAAQISGGPDTNAAIMGHLARLG